jgi:hypothetical protein
MQQQQQQRDCQYPRTTTTSFPPFHRIHNGKKMSYSPLTLLHFEFSTSSSSSSSSEGDVAGGTMTTMTERQNNAVAVDNCKEEEEEQSSTTSTASTKTSIATKKKKKKMSSSSSRLPIDPYGPLKSILSKNDEDDKNSNNNNDDDDDYLSQYTLPPTILGRDDYRTTLKPQTRIVAFGDVHGDIDALRTFLITAMILDPTSTNDEPVWSGGSTICIQTGDVLDRGDDELACFRLLATLSRQAVKAGGALLL